MTIRALNDKTQELFEGSLKTCQDAFQAEMDWLQEAAGVTLTWCVWFRLWTLRRFLKVLPCDREANKMPVEQKQEVAVPVSQEDVTLVPEVSDVETDFPDTTNASQTVVNTKSHQDDENEEVVVQKSAKLLAVVSPENQNAAQPSTGQENDSFEQGPVLVKPKLRIMNGRTRHKAKGILAANPVDAVADGQIPISQRTSVETQSRALNKAPQSIDVKGKEYVAGTNELVADTNTATAERKTRKDTENKQPDFASPKSALLLMASKADLSRMNSDLRIKSTVSSSLDVLRKGLMTKPQSAPRPSVITGSDSFMAASDQRINDSIEGSILSVANTSMSVRSSGQELSQVLAAVHSMPSVLEKQGIAPHLSLDKDKRTFVSTLVQPSLVSSILPPMETVKTQRPTLNLKSIAIESNSLEKDRRTVIKELQEARLKATQKRKLESQLFMKQFHDDSEQTLKKPKTSLIHSEAPLRAKLSIRSSIPDMVPDGNHLVQTQKKSLSPIPDEESEPMMDVVLEKPQATPVAPASSNDYKETLSSQSFSVKSKLPTIAPISNAIIPSLDSVASPAKAKKPLSIAQDPVVEIQSCHPSPLPAKKELLAPENSSPFNNAILDSFLEPKTKSGVKISANGPSTILDENGNLPEIQTDSDEDEDYLSPQPNKVQVANWAQTPYLRGALSAQQTKDPDAIFGEVKPIQLEDVFKGQPRVQKFRARTSSGNWNNSDQLTAEEISFYRKRMGFDD